MARKTTTTSTTPARRRVTTPTPAAPDFAKMTKAQLVAFAQSLATSDPATPPPPDGPLMEPVTFVETNDGRGERFGRVTCARRHGVVRLGVHHGFIAKDGSEGMSLSATKVPYVSTQAEARVLIAALAEGMQHLPE